MLVNLGVSAALTYGAVGALLYLAQRTIIYQPSRESPRPAEWGLGDMAPVVPRAADGLALSAWWRAPARDSAPAIVYLHGNAGHIGHRGRKVRPFLDAGLGLLLLDWRGYGASPGAPDEAGLYADARAALAFVEGEGVAPERIVLYGESLGSAPAVLLASERRFGALVLEAPFTSVFALARRRFPIYPVGLMLRDRYDTLSRIGRVTTPLLIIHGEADRIVPPAHGRALYAAARARKEALFVPGAGHNDLAEHGIAARVLAFIADHVPEATPSR